MSDATAATAAKGKRIFDLACDRLTKLCHEYRRLPVRHYRDFGIHFSWHNDWEGLQGLLPVVEEALAPLQVRPHWGKVFTLKQEQVASQYPRLDEFKGLLRDFDPDGKFRNAFLDRYLFG